MPAITVNRVCVSSAAALAWAATNIKAGDGELFLVGGIENMTRAPWVLQNGRSGYRMGMPSAEMFDAMVWDGLWDAAALHMGVTAENLCEQFDISKEQQDEVAYQSQLRATGDRRRPLQGRDRPRRDPATQGRPQGHRHGRVPARDLARDRSRVSSRSSRRAAS